MSKLGRKDRTRAMEQSSWFTEFSIEETCYGFRKRLLFLEEVIRNTQPACILDIGCGTGAYLTAPLAKRFPAIFFLGIDEDSQSIAKAQQDYQFKNLSFSTSKDFQPNRLYDLIILSEVLEHVEEPIEFLRSIGSYLRPEGNLIITIPNGYGPFEALAVIDHLAHFSGLYRLMSALRRLVYPKTRSIYQPKEGTCADSPHLNFFSLKRLRHVCEEGGFGIVLCRNRTILCGPLVETILNKKSLSQYNADCADYLPSLLVSGWMFQLKREKVTNPQPRQTSYVRTANEEYRKKLNLVRSGLLP